VDKEKFKEKLNNEHKWPDEYTFKFIVPVNKEDELEKRLAGFEISKKNSKNGNYLSVTVKKIMDSADAVMEVYDKVSQIEGIISL